MMKLAAIAPKSLKAPAVVKGAVTPAKPNERPLNIPVPRDLPLAALLTYTGAVFLLLLNAFISFFFGCCATIQF